MILGIDIGGTKTSVCAGDADGRILFSARMPSLPERGPDDWMKRLFRLAQEVLAESGIDLTDVRSIGISAPGPLSVQRGALLSPPNMTGWETVPVIAPVQDHFGRPVYMNNDANAGVLAEWLWGGCAGTKDMIFLTMSTGLGAGIIAGGTLVQGACDMGGEAGYHVLDPMGPASPCGHRGSFEAFCGGKNAADRFSRRMKYPRPADFRHFMDEVRRKNPIALEEWEIYIEHLAQGIGNLIMILNPSIILLGTIAMHTGSIIFDELSRRLPAYTVPEALKACRIEAATLGRYLGDHAALAVAAKNMAQ
ncbi:MAG TPA: ROK family protein [Kiritimatiellia bacterium]|nr:ROK family protein [Kiritimatiellia bacterium]HNS79988.1 ROK family protein [Kiritimatiellia bacterium]HPA77079.1 ROK family protein [Kiritimatiellia bacterium]HQQ03364.1 ROK family protein [Kiritimatiellia bacterium]